MRGARVTLLDRCRRKVRHLCQEWAVERLLAEGIAPVVARRMYGCRHRQPPSPGTVRSVLVWNVDSPGDFLWVTPVLRALREGYPGAEVTLVYNRACLALAETNRNVDRLVAIDPAPFYIGRGLVLGVPELVGGQFDVMVVLEMGSRPADAARILGRRLGVGYLVSSDLGILKSLPDHTLPPNRGEYWPAYFLRAVEHLGLKRHSLDLEVVTTPDDDAGADAVLGPKCDDRRITIGFHPYVAPYALSTKKWPDASFVALSALLAASQPTRFVLTGSPEEARDCDRLAGMIRAATGAEVVSAAGRLSLRAVVSLYRGLDVLVTGDTAALHLATSAGVATVVLFGSTDDRLIAPPTPRCIVINQRLPCSPCLRYADRRPAWPVCLFDHPVCMHQITPFAVTVAVERLLAVSSGRDESMSHVLGGSSGCIPSIDCSKCSDSD